MVDKEIDSIKSVNDKGFSPKSMFLNKKYFQTFLKMRHLLFLMTSLIIILHYKVLTSFYEYLAGYL